MTARIALCIVIHVTASIAIAGASGYAGAEIARLLLGHPGVEIRTLTAHSSAGDYVASHHGHLAALADLKFEQTTAKSLAGHDVVFLALPHGASGQIAAELPPETLVIDCGADHRLIDAAAWEKFYGSTHAGTWTYGMPELVRADGTSQREELRATRRIAVPGCNVTAVTLALLPAAGWAAMNSVVAVLANGYSGAGKALKPHLLAAEALGGATAYSVGGIHRHIPEIEQNLTLAGVADAVVTFIPTLVPMARGIHATVIFDTPAGFESVTSTELHQRWFEFYAAEPVVQMLGKGRQPHSRDVVGANTCQLQVTRDTHSGKIVVTSVIDNLVKGTAGAAIQSMNLALGLPELTALSTQGVAP